MKCLRVLVAVAISVGLMGSFGGCGGHSQVTSGSGDGGSTVSLTPTEAAINITKDTVSVSMSLPAPELSLSKAAPANIADRCDAGPHGDYTCPQGGSVRIDGDCLLAESDDCALILDPLTLVFSECATNDDYTIDGTLVVTAILFMPGCSADGELTMQLDTVSEAGLVVTGGASSGNVNGFSVRISPTGITIISNSAPGETECASNGDCQVLSVPLICYDGSCQPPCASDYDCRDGASCVIDQSAWTALGFSGLTNMGMCGEEPEIPDEICDNGIDDDLDQDVDCDDLDCIDDPACIEPEICNNATDDDRDGLTDCDDDDCFLSEGCEYDCTWDSCQVAVEWCLGWPEFCDCPSGDCTDLTADQYCTANLWDDATCVSGCCKTVDPVCDISCESAMNSCIALVDEEWCDCDPETPEYDVCDESYTGDWCSAWWWGTDMTCVEGCCILVE